AIVDRQARIDGLEGGHRAPGTCEAEPACGTGDGPVSHLGQRLVPAQPPGAIGYAVCPVIVRFRDRRLLLLPEQGEKLGLVLAEQHQVLSRDAADVVQPWPMGLELDATAPEPFEEDRGPHTHPSVGARGVPSMAGASHSTSSESDEGNEES